jgi:hypothetical protein
VGPLGDSYSMQQLIAAVRDSRDGGAGEPAGGRSQALRARAALREGRGLEHRDYRGLDGRQKALFDAYINGTLARNVDQANDAYGHGIARTNDYGYAPGQNMCKQKPKVQAIAHAVWGTHPHAGAVEPGHYYA